MSATRVSMAEITRVGPWAMRALGYPFGVAERATRLLAWTEAATGDGLALLRRETARIEASTRTAASPWAATADGSRRLAAPGRSLFEIGPPAIDLATADFRLKGRARLAIDGAEGVGLIPGLTDLAAQRGFGLVVVHGGEAGGAAPSGWHAAVQTPAGPSFSTGPLVDRQDPLDALRSAQTPLSASETTAILHAADAALRAARGETGHIGVVALSAPGSPAQGGAAIDYPARLARAYRDGLLIATEDLAHLYALERLTWAPTSERSRRQAGY